MFDKDDDDSLKSATDKCYAIRISRNPLGVCGRLLACTHRCVSLCAGVWCVFALRNYEDALIYIFNRKKLPTLDTAPTFNCFPYQRIMCCHVGNAFQCLVFSLDTYISPKFIVNCSETNVNFIAYTHTHTHTCICIPSSGPHTTVLDALEVHIIVIHETIMLHASQ